ncbi:MAG: BamA/TamA family outer membrane protein, partial [Bacteroidetes bacterium]|nr:BamA/TamA family outer membrane protein [Bacteroidota bacterium]
ATPIEAPVLNLDEIDGGLTIVKRGGGLQTKSLRLTNQQGRQYVLRTIRKFQEDALPDEYRGTFIESFFKDQVSGLHPYGAIAIPTLADAAQVYHTNPLIVYILPENQLNEFQDEFGGQLALLEERPDEDRSDVYSFGRSKNIIGTRKLLEKIYEDNDDYVDQWAMLRARMFDMWVGDWDRHEDQWRWASFKQGKTTLYRPVPRDRDYVFFSYDGFIPRNSTKKWGNRFRRHFDYKITDEFGLNFKAANIDRGHLNDLSLDDWINVIDSMQLRLTDQVIEQAFEVWPDSVRQLSAPEIIDKLKSRREQLKEVAQKYYPVLAKEVDVVGSDKRDYFEINRLNNSETSVKVFKIEKTGEREKKIYDRVFNQDETEVINIYGNQGKDIFKITGEASNSIRIRIIGGEGEDEFIDQSSGNLKKKYTKVYDDPEEENQLTLNEKSKFIRNLDPEWYRFEYYNFKYDYGVPQIFAGFNSDDGVLIGGGMKFIKFGFGKSPYASSHTYLGRVSFLTGAAEIRYTGEFKAVIAHKWDLVTYLKLPLPSIVQNFFGFGNDTEQTNPDDDFNRLRLVQITFRPYLSRTINNHHTITGGFQFQHTDLTDTTGKFITEAFLSNPQEIANSWQYITTHIGYEYEKLDHEWVPTKGIDFENEMNWNYRVGQENNDFLQIKSDVRIYVPLIKTIETVLALRVGGAHNFGDFDFFQANTIGGSKNVRGFRGDRFSGRSSFYQNTELRISLLKFRNPLLTGKLGLILFSDIGRVWADGMPSDTWHHGYGGGIMLIPFNLGAITTVYEVSDERNQFRLKFGFQF